MTIEEQMWWYMHRRDVFWGHKLAQNIKYQHKGARIREFTGHGSGSVTRTRRILTWLIDQGLCERTKHGREYYYKSLGDDYRAKKPRVSR